MFTKARFKLTGWYLLLIMSVCFLFSAVIYRGFITELKQGLYRTESHLRSRERVFGIQIPDEVQDLLLSDFENSRQRVLNWLFFTNGIIFLFSAGASFALAGKTLQPIQNALEEQKRFISDASHELHTPLTALKTSIEVALREKHLSQIAARLVLKENLEEVDELAALTENLLSLSRYEKNGQSVQFTRVDLGDLILAVVKRLTPLARKKEIILETQIENQVVNVDEASITKLLTILIDNAIKYTKKKGSISVTAKQKSQYASISIADTGIGIPKKELPHIFDRFYRADASRTKENTAGYGLGLSIAQQIVDIHQGTMSVDSKVGKGTTFTVNLPSSSL